MKVTRKLIPAVVLLLVSAMMLSTASYAWFSMNKDVTATGMQIEAKSDAQFLIINAGSTFDNSGESLTVISAASRALKPVKNTGTIVVSASKTAVETNANWQYAYSNSVNKSEKYGDYIIVANGKELVDDGTYAAGTNDYGYLGKEEISIGLKTGYGATQTETNLLLKSITLPKVNASGYEVSASGKTVVQNDVGENEIYLADVNANKDASYTPTASTVETSYYTKLNEANKYIAAVESDAGAKKIIADFNAATMIKLATVQDSVFYPASITLGDTKVVATTRSEVTLNAVIVVKQTDATEVVKYIAATDAANANADLGVKATTTGTLITVYYFVNGDSGAVYTNNLANLNGMKVQMTFGVA